MYMYVCEVWNRPQVCKFASFIFPVLTIKKVRIGGILFPGTGLPSSL